MDTKEHLELGNSLRFTNWDVLEGNPYVHIDTQTGILSIDVQGVDDDNLPYSTQLKLSSGDIVAMSGDYFGGKEVSCKLPSLAEFKENPEHYDNSISLGHYLINKAISVEEKDKFIRSYTKLANPQLKQSEIETIYKIDKAQYIPFSETLNSYVQQAMFALRVNNYSEMLLRNLSHFTPWSVRAATVGHHLALGYAALAHEFQQLANDSNYVSHHHEFNTHCQNLAQTAEGLSSARAQDLAHRFQALALGMEFFSFHYFSDHFAAGHCQPMGDLREELPKQHGTLGSILVNNLHDESNRITIYTKRPYDPNPDETAPPVIAAGDGDFDESKNYYNKQACVVGMQASLGDIKQLFEGGAKPEQADYAGLKHLPDIDPNYRQPQPLFILGGDKKIYYRNDISTIRILAPSQWKAAYEAPAENGYTRLSGWKAFLLVAKLRLLSFIYESKIQELSEEELEKIEQEELALNPMRRPIPRPPVETTTAPTPIPEATTLNWQRPAASASQGGLNRYSLFYNSSEPVVQEETSPALSL